MSKLILLRHGQSVWNLENRFTGWVDVELSKRGEKEASEAGEKLKGVKIHRLFTSVLKRAVDTATIVMKVIGDTEIPTKRDQALNERNYGDLEGQNKDEVREKYGADQVHIWRRSYDVKPPRGESLKDTCLRVLPFYYESVLPCIKVGENVLIVAHGNSLRGLIKEIEGLGEDEIISVEVPTGVPIVYDMDRKAKIIEKTVF